MLMLVTIKKNKQSRLKCLPGIAGKGWGEYLGTEYLGGTCAGAADGACAGAADGADDDFSKGKRGRLNICHHGLLSTYGWISAGAAST